MNTYPICDSPLYRTGRRSFAPLQKSRQTIRSYVWTEALSAMVLLPAQKLSSVVWGIIGNNTLINIDAKNVEAKCSVSTKWEFYVGYFHSNFHHLNWFADTVRPFLGRDSAFSWRYSKSYTYDQLMAGTSVQDYKGDTFTWHGTRFQFFSEVLPFFGLRGGWGMGEGKGVGWDSKKDTCSRVFQTLGDLAKRITRETSVYLNVTFLLNLELNSILNSILITYMLHNSYGVF